MSDKLALKIAKAALDVGGKLNPDKRNQEQRYDYLSADKILSVCGQALFTQGVAVMPEVAGQELTVFEYVDQYQKAKRRYDYRVDFVFNITDGEETIERMWYGMGSDYTVPDKALYKAITSGHKYFLMKLLCVGAGNEDGEHEADEQPRQQAQPRRNGNGNGSAPEPPQPPDDYDEAPPPAAPPVQRQQAQNGERPYAPAVVKQRLEQYAEMAAKKGWAIKDTDRKMLAVNLGNCFPDNQDDARHTVLKYLTGKASANEITIPQVIAVKKWLEVSQDETGDWAPSAYSITEARAIYTAAIEAEGQGKLL